MAADQLFNSASSLVNQLFQELGFVKFLDESIFTLLMPIEFPKIEQGLIFIKL